MFKHFENLNDFEKAFPNERACIDHFCALRWASGPSCVHCGSRERIYDLKLGRFKCGDCQGRWTVRHDTIFGDSRLALRVWFKAIFLMTSHKKGISSHQLARDLGVTQKTAWFMLHRIRNASLTEEFKGPLKGDVEADQCYIGGKGKWKHASKKRGKPGNFEGDKASVLGLLRRDGDLRLIDMGMGMHPYQKRMARDIIREHVAPGSRIHTDEGAQFLSIGVQYTHDVVRHSLGEYVRGDVTTNRIEGAFGHFKRAIHGVYHQISRNHLDSYLQMFAWRWNRREMGEGERVNALLCATQRKRITYRQLTRKDARNAPR